MVFQAKFFLLNRSAVLFGGSTRTVEDGTVFLDDCWLLDLEKAMKLNNHSPIWRCIQRQGWIHQSTLPDFKWNLGRIASNLTGFTADLIQNRFRNPPNLIDERPTGGDCPQETSRGGAGARQSTAVADRRGVEGGSHEDVAQRRAVKSARLGTGRPQHERGQRQQPQGPNSTEKKLA